jgi:hypothetical protein
MERIVGMCMRQNRGTLNPKPKIQMDRGPLTRGQARVSDKFYSGSAAGKASLSARACGKPQERRVFQFAMCMRQAASDVGFGISDLGFGRDIYADEGIELIIDYRNHKHLPIRNPNPQS